MRRTATRRVRALVVAGALAVGMIAGPAAAQADVGDGGPTMETDGLNRAKEVRSDAEQAPWNRDLGGGITIAGWSWL